MKKLQYLLLLVIFSLPFLYQIKPIEILKLKTFDALVPEKKPSDYFTILNITENDIAIEGGYP